MTRVKVFFSYGATIGEVAVDYAKKRCTFFGIPYWKRCHLGDEEYNFAITELSRYVRVIHALGIVEKQGA